MSACSSEPDHSPVAFETVRQALSTLPPGFREEIVFSAHSEPTAVRFSPDGRVLVAEKQGRLWLYPSVNHAASPTLVVDLRTSVHNFWDRGLLGLAVDPEFPARPYLYVLYTLDANSETPTPPAWGTVDGASDDCPNPPGATGEGCVVNAQLSRIEVDLQTWQGIETPLLAGNWCQQFPSHSAGDLTFGESGALYVSAGEGASFNQADWGQLGNNPCADPLNEGGGLRAQDLLSPGDAIGFSGSIIRLDVSGSTPTPAAGNPRETSATEAEAFVVAMGLRNPYRMAARPGTDELWIADVGWTTVEELNVLDSLAEVTNFGWPCYEGSGTVGTYASNELCQQLYDAVPDGMRLAAPFYAYGHNSFVLDTDGCAKGSSSITGVAFNSADAYPKWYEGALFFTDSTRRCLWSLPANSEGIPQPGDRTFFAKTTGRAVDLQQGPDGFLYYADFDGGNIYRYAYYPTNTPPRARVAPSVSSGPAPLLVQFDASASSDDEDGNDITFAWDLNDDGVFGDASGSLVTHEFDTPGLHRVWVRVSDSQQMTSTAVVTVSAGNTAPVPEILSPLPSDRWSVGDLITLRGRAVDPESGPVPDENLSWNITMRHCDLAEQCHSHPITTLAGATASFVAPAHEYPSHLRIELVAKDGGGPDWALPGWVRRGQVTVVGDYQSEETLRDVPILLHLQPSRFDYSIAAPLGEDLRVLDEQGRLLDHEIETWAPGAGSAVWVKLPELSAASGERLFLYYGNPEAPLREASPQVWSNAYEGVWHLGDDLRDAVTQSQGVNHGATTTLGPFGDASSFDGTGGFAILRQDLPLETSLTVEAWIHQGATVRNNADNILSTKSSWSAAEGFNLEVNFATSTMASLGAGTDFLKSSSLELTPQWHHVVSAMDGSEGHLYLDGVDVTSDGTIGRVRASALPLHLGRAAGGNGFFMGNIDEVRLSSVVRSRAWIGAQYLAGTDQLFRYNATEASHTLTGSMLLEYYPKTQDATFESEPPGLILYVNGVEKTTPFVETAIWGTTLSISAPVRQDSMGHTYEFDAWSDFAQPDRSIIIDEESVAFLVRYACPAGANCAPDDTSTDITSTDVTNPPCADTCSSCTSCNSEGTTDDPSPTGSSLPTTSSGPAASSSTSTGSASTEGGLPSDGDDSTTAAESVDVSGVTSSGPPSHHGPDASASVDETGSSPPTEDGRTSRESTSSEANKDAGAGTHSSLAEPSSSTSSGGSTEGLSDASITPSDAGSRAMDAGTAVPQDDEGGGSGCGCRVGAASRRPAGLGILLYLVGHVFWRRRRRT